MSVKITGDWHRIGHVQMYVTFRCTSHRPDLSDHRLALKYQGIWGVAPVHITNGDTDTDYD